MIPESRDDLRSMAELAERIRLSAKHGYTEACQRWLERQGGAPRVLLTHSGAAALEMAMLLAGIGWGNEVIMPSCADVGAANAAVLRGARPVFVDIRPDTLQLDERLVEAALTRHTRAIVSTGGAADIRGLLAVARKHDLLVIEDGSQADFAVSRKRPPNRRGDLGAISFHASQSGALVINEPEWIEEAERICRHGTAGPRWHTLGAAFAPSEITAAFLWAHLQSGDATARCRQRQWRRYHQAFAPLADAGLLQRPEAAEPAHGYRLLLPTPWQRDATLAALADIGMRVAPAPLPLHQTPAGGRYGRVAGPMRVTEDVAARLIALPLHERLTEAEQAAVIAAVRSGCEVRAAAA